MRSLLVNMDMSVALKIVMGEKNYSLMERVKIAQITKECRAKVAKIVDLILVVKEKD